ncbi:MAG: hypothetical protein K0U66_00735, partial [Gammaproteobacteria bacterium]|nr:hypothetical protein [Gammaproteobacteria bacterium]
MESGRGMHRQGFVAVAEVEWHVPGVWLLWLFVVFVRSDFVIVIEQSNIVSREVIEYVQTWKIFFGLKCCLHFVGRKCFLRFFSGSSAVFVLEGPGAFFDFFGLKCCLRFGGLKCFLCFFRAQVLYSFWWAQVLSLIFSGS